MKTHSLFPALAAAFLTLFPHGLRAQERTVVVSSRSIEHFELDGGLEFQTREVVNGNVSTFGIKKFQLWPADSRSPRVNGPEFEFISRHSDELRAGSTASGRYLFSAGSNGILRFKRQSPNPDSEAPAILATSGSVPWFSSAGFPNGSDLAVIGDRIYWGEVDGSRVQIWSHELEPGGFPILHAQANYSGGGAFKIKRLVQFSPSQGLALTFNGLLYAFTHNDLFTVLNGPSAMTLLATNVTGFDTRTDTVSAGEFSTGETAVYFTVQNAGSPGSAPATVQRRRYRALTGWTSPTLLYSSSLGESGFFDSLTEVTLNSKYLYVRRAPVSLFLGSPTVGVANSTFRADNPAASPLSSLFMEAIPADGNNLRSDNLFLYYARGAGIYRVAAGVAPIPIVKLDFEALGVEITQSIQTLDHRVGLVVNKRTFVRGYARERINLNTGVTSFSPSARLRVFFRPAFPLGLPEVEITDPNFPLLPVNRPTISPLPMGTTRYDTTVSYLWELPPHLINRAGWMRAEMTLIPGGAATETRDPDNITLDPALNNKASTSHPGGLGVYFTPMPEPCLLFIPVETYGTRYTGASLAKENLGVFIERAITQLPVAAMRHWVAMDLEIDDLAGGPLDMDAWGAKEVAMADLYKLWFFYKDPPGAADTHWVGCVHERAESFPGRSPVRFNGLGSDGEQSIITLRTRPYGNSSWPGNSSWGGFNLAHELGHNWDQDHVNCGNPDGPNLSYPYNPCWIGPGNPFLSSARCAFDPISKLARDETTLADLMSYGREVWVSDYTWDRLLFQIIDDDGFPSPSAAPSLAGRAAQRAPRGVGAGGGNFFTLTGLYDPAQHTAMLSPNLCQPEADFSPAAIAKSMAEAAAVLDPVLVCRQRSATGSLLIQTPVVLKAFDNDTANDGPGTIIAQLVGAEPGAARIEIVETASGRILAGSVTSAHAPVASVTIASLDTTARRARVEWSATDADGDPLTFTLLYRGTTNQGAITRILRSGTRDLEADISLDSLPAGTGHFTLMVTDGFRSLEVQTAGITVDEHAPNLVISGIVAGQELDLWAANVPATHLCAAASDVDDASFFSPATTHWQWSGPEPGSLDGCGVTLNRLFPGNYTMTASITDSSSNTVTETFPFTVPPLTVLDAPSMTLDGIRDAADYGTAPAVTWTLTDGSQASASMAHHDGALYVMIEGLPLSPNAVGAGFLIDANGSRSAGLEADDFGIEVTTQGALTLWTGATGNWTRAAAPAALVEAATFIGETQWAVELRIPDVVIGGWGHAASIRTYALKTFPYDAFPATSGHQAPASWFPVSFGPRPAPAPVAPMANIVGGGSLAPEPGQSFQLDGSGSSTSQGNSIGLTYAWSQVSGPLVSLTGADQPLCSFIHGPVAAPVTLVFQLVVTAGGLASHPETASYYFYPAPDETTWSEASPNGAVADLDNNPDGSVQLNYDADFWYGDNGELEPLNANSLPITGAMFEIDASNDLGSWECIAIVPADAAGNVGTVDLPPPGAGRRFYRLHRAGVEP